MKKRIQSLLIILIAILFFTACEKEENSPNCGSISGILTPGENVSAEDLNGLTVYLGRFHDSVDFSSISFNTTAIDFITTTTLNSDGSFSFIGLTNGNYGLALEEGLIFTGDTVLSIQLNGENPQYINQSIERVPDDNMHVGGTGDLYIYLKEDNLSSSYKINKLHCYFDSELHGSYDIPEFNNNTVDNWNFTSISNLYTVEFKIDVCEVDNSGAITNTFTSAKIPYYSKTNKTSTNTWSENSLNIKWVPYYKESGWWPFGKEEIFGHYIISKN